MSRVRRDTSGGGTSPAGSAVGTLTAVSIAAAGILALLVVSGRSAAQAAPGVDQVNDSRARAVFETTADFWADEHAEKQSELA